MGKYSLHVLKRKHWVIFFSALVGVGWFSLVLYTIAAGKQAQVITPGAVATQSIKTETPRSVPSITPERNGFHAKGLTEREVSTPPPSALLPQPQMTSTSMHLHQTSDATAHIVGSDVNYEATTGNGSSNRNKGISYNGLGYGGNMLAMSSAIVLSQPGAGYANDLAETVSAPDKRGMLKGGFPDPNEGPFEDEKIPIGDIAWGLMAVLGIAWCARVHRRRQQCN